MSSNWLKSRLELLDIGTSELSRSLEERGLIVSRQVLDNWLKMDGERIPIGVGNVSLIDALAEILQYEDLAHFLLALGHRLDLEKEDRSSLYMSPIIRDLRKYNDEEAKAIAIILEQILLKWNEIERLMKQQSDQDEDC